MPILFDEESSLGSKLRRILREQPFYLQVKLLQFCRQEMKMCNPQMTYVLTVQREIIDGSSLSPDRATVSQDCIQNDCLIRLLTLRYLLCTLTTNLLVIQGLTDHRQACTPYAVPIK